MTAPFRDEVETLRRENERLHAELARARRVAPRLAPRVAFGLLIALVDAGTAMLVRPWLNTGNDVQFWGALALLATITLAAALTALGYKPR